MTTPPPHPHTHTHPSPLVPRRSGSRERTRKDASFTWGVGMRGGETYRFCTQRGYAHPYGLVSNRKVNRPRPEIRRPKSRRRSGLCRQGVNVIGEVSVFGVSS